MTINRTTVYPEFYQYGYDLARNLREEASVWYPGLAGHALKDHILDRITDHQAADLYFEQMACRFDNEPDPDSAWLAYEQGIDDYLRSVLEV